MKNLYIVGAGGLGRELLNHILDIHLLGGPCWNIKGFLDDTADPLKDKKCDFPVAGTIESYYPKPDDVLVMGIAAPAAKKRISGILKGRGAIFETLIHPHANLGRHNHIGEGSVIYPGFGMTVNIKIGNFCTLLACAIGHDVTVGDFCTISSCCNIMGKVKIEESVYIGGNCGIAPGVKIESDAYICLGSMVMKNVKAGVKILGNPAKEIG